MSCGMLLHTRFNRLAAKNRPVVLTSRKEARHRASRGRSGGCRRIGRALPLRGVELPFRGCFERARGSGSLPRFCAAAFLDPEIFDLVSGLHRSHEPARALAAPRPGLGGLRIAVFR